MFGDLPPPRGQDPIGQPGRVRLKEPRATRRGSTRMSVAASSLTPGDELAETVVALLEPATIVAMPSSPWTVTTTLLS